MWRSLGRPRSAQTSKTCAVTSAPSPSRGRLREENPRSVCRDGYSAKCTGDCSRPTATKARRVLEGRRFSPCWASEAEIGRWYSGATLITIAKVPS